VKLTPQQRSRLVTYAMFHRQPPTVADQMKRIVPQLGTFAFLGLVAIAGTLVDDPFLSRLALVMLGFTLGMAISAVTVVRMTLHQWPLVEYITDWSRVEELQREHTLETE
jgi:hypothetical protein